MDKTNETAIKVLKVTVKVALLVSGIIASTALVALSARSAESSDDSNDTSDDITPLPKFKVRLHYASGEVEDEDELYGSIEDADYRGLQALGEISEGAEILNISNPDDYPCDGDGVGNDYEIIKTYL